MRASALYRIVFSALLPFAAQQAGAADTPAPGGYGFDWLHPQQAKCAKLREPLIARFRSCSFQGKGGFDGATETHTCRLNSTVEYLIFKNRKICQDQLETMQANAP